MKNISMTVARITLVLTFIVAGPVFGQELTDAEEAMLAAEAQRHVELYYNYYYERDPDSLSTDIFNLPWSSLGENGISTTVSEAENMEYFESAIDGLLSRGWDRSIYTTVSVCVLSRGAAIVSGTNTRTRADGSIMSVGGVTYILGKTDDEWRILSFAGHSPRQIVSCERM